jgi:predicted DNA-binding transcriptional regulator AlpA
MSATMLKTKDVLVLLGISRASLYIGVRDGIYPKPLRLGPKGRDSLLATGSNSGM